MIFLWIDILMGCVLARGVFSGKKGSLIPEFIKLIGVYCATFLALHYYVEFGKTVDQYLKVGDITSEFLAFSLLVVIISFVFYLFSEGWSIILRLEVGQKFNEFGASVLSFARHYLFCALILVAFVLMGNPGLTKVTKQSFSFRLFKDTSIGIYKAFHTNIVERFMPEEKVNPKAIRIMTAEIKRKRKLDL